MSAESVANNNTKQNGDTQSKAHFKKFSMFKYFKIRQRFTMYLITFDELYIKTYKCKF